MQKFFETWDADLVDINKDKKELYNVMLAKMEEDPANVDTIWRMVEVCLVIADSYEKVSNKTDAEKYIVESEKYAKKGVEVDPGSMLAHKWYCASVGRLADYVGIKERIKCGYEFKEHHDIAVKIDPNDQLMHHMYGRWCYEVASLNIVERTIAEAFFATPPTSSYAEALDSLLKADALCPDWIANKLWMTKAYAALDKYSEAIKAADEGMALPVLAEEDAVAHTQLKELQKDYAKYRK